MAAPRANPVPSAERQRRLRQRREENYGMVRHDIWITAATDGHWQEIKERSGLERIRELMAFIFRRECEQERTRGSGQPADPPERWMTPQAMADAQAICAVDGADSVRHAVEALLRKMRTDQELEDGKSLEGEGGGGNG